MRLGSATPPVGSREEQVLHDGVRGESFELLDIQLGLGGRDPVALLREKLDQQAKDLLRVVDDEGVRGSVVAGSWRRGARFRPAEGVLESLGPW